jgi:hypothetical protein
VVADGPGREELQALRATLERLCHGSQFEAGSSLSFQWDPAQSRLEVGLDGQEPMALPARAVAAALFAVYLDEQPIAPGAKQAFAAGSARLQAA